MTAFELFRLLLAERYQHGFAQRQVLVLQENGDRLACHAAFDADDNLTIVVPMPEDE